MIDVAFALDKTHASPSSCAAALAGMGEGGRRAPARVQGAKGLLALGQGVSRMFLDALVHGLACAYWCGASALRMPKRVPSTGPAFVLVTVEVKTAACVLRQEVAPHGSAGTLHC